MLLNPYGGTSTMTFVRRARVTRPMRVVVDTGRSCATRGLTYEVQSVRRLKKFVDPRERGGQADAKSQRDPGVFSRLSIEMSCCSLEARSLGR